MTFAGIGIAAIVVIATSIIASGDNLPEPDVVIDQPIEVPPPSPDEALIAELWAELSAAYAEDSTEQFGAAFARLHDVQARTASLLIQFPANSALLQVADSIAGQIEWTVSRCNALSLVNRNRNRTAPVCAPVTESDSTMAPADSTATAADGVAVDSVTADSVTADGATTDSIRDPTS